MNINVQNKMKKELETGLPDIRAKSSSFFGVKHLTKKKSLATKLKAQPTNPDAFLSSEENKANEQSQKGLEEFLKTIGIPLEK